MLIRETGWRVYENSLYYPHNFSGNLKLLKQSLFKKAYMQDNQENF